MAKKKELDFKSTKELKVSKKIIDQVMGQDDGVEVIKRAASQRRHVFLEWLPKNLNVISSGIIISGLPAFPTLTNPPIK